MSHLLWKYYWDNDVDRFRRLLSSSGIGSQSLSKSPAIGSPSAFAGHHSPGGLGSSPRTKNRKVSGYSLGKSKDIASASVGRAEINSRDHAGLTILLRAASSTDPRAPEFVQALVEHPATDIYAQDPESGWNALHRSLYTGNVSIARILLGQERANLTSITVSSVTKVGQLIKTKDHEGNSPFDVYNSTIATRSLKKDAVPDNLDSDSDSGESLDDVPQTPVKYSQVTSEVAEGDELFVFGSNRNMSLGVGDEDDRQYPERILLNRPEHLLNRFYDSFNEQNGLDDAPFTGEVEDIPILAQSRRLVVQDVVMSKLHTAVISADPVSNLYVCGVGRGGRLGLGDENTQFKFVPVQGPLADKSVKQVALGQNHSMAIVGNGELWTWGLNSDAQLGYTLPPPLRADEEPMSLVPRQVFGPLKKEVIQGIAASSIHSVAHTGSSLYCWGKNIGQLALMDADSRSLDVQSTPRRVAASLLTAPIEMVSAIDKATTVLLSNCAVWVFTNYGYNQVKFPVPDVFINHNLATTSFATRNDAGRRDIRYITSGDNTIAALTARGDLFTMQVNHKVEVNQPPSSTTNPAKIKGAITQPQCIWDSRKEGVVSADVGEHGSVIICTESGSVWTRVKRATGKVTGFADPSMAKRKDFKFQRVPYITNCVTVRSSTFGAFSAIRRDSRVMSKEINIDDKTIWDDIGRLLCLNDFSTAAPLDLKGPRKAWEMAISREKPGSVAYEILRAVDLEVELEHWLKASTLQYSDLDMQIRSSLCPDVRIPVHSWLLSARSPILRQALQTLQMQGTSTSDDLFQVEIVDGQRVLTLLNADIFTVLNVVVYIYHDTMIPVWKYTREASIFAHRFRQVRNEVMKVATKLQMAKLEIAARLQNNVEPSLDSDFLSAIADVSYFDDGDVIIQLDGEEVLAHTQLLCERCPFFKGMFQGRSGGEWLSQRRLGTEAAEPVEVDLSHIRPDTFELVLQHLYGDVGEELFDTITASSLDEFSEIVLDVLAVANELMLDRLSQVCQSVLGKFVTTRNIALLLNEISPCSVTEFKDVGLEYICLQLENMLENCLLDGMDEEVLLELDEVVRKNQLARLPFVRSGRADLILHEAYPDLLFDIEEERQRRVREFAFKYTQKEEERKLSSSYRARIGSLDEFAMSPQTPDGFRRKSKGARNEPFSPSLRPKDSQADMIFNMDEDTPKLKSPLVIPLSPELGAEFDKLDLDNMPQLPGPWQPLKNNEPADLSKGRNMSVGSVSSPIASPNLGPQSARSGAAPWASPILASTKFDLKDIMTEAGSKSTLTASLAAQKLSEGSRPQVKISQKERKKQMQKQAEAQAAVQDEKANNKPWEGLSGNTKKPAPWKATVASPRTTLQEAMAMAAQQPATALVNAKPLVASEATSARTRTASPDTKFSGQRASRNTASKEERAPLTPHSKSYMQPARKTEPILGATMADIIGQQRREQEMAKEAVAKRSLQEIQQEQAFQEWWDQESQRAQAEEAKRNAKNNRDKDEANNKRNRRGRGGGKTGKGGKEPAREGSGVVAAAAAVASGPKATTSSSQPRAAPRGRSTRKVGVST